MKNCFFIGHRDADNQLLPRIIEAAERLILEEHVTVFYVGRYGNFDRMAGQAIVQLKIQYPSILLYLVLPYHPADKPMKAPAGYDGTFYPDGMESVPPRYAISRANYKMIDTCDFLIAYVTHTVSNACNLWEYAMHRQKKGLIRVINLR